MAKEPHPGHNQPHRNEDEPEEPERGQERCPDDDRRPRDWGGQHPVSASAEAGCEKYGSDNSVYAARVVWKKPNRLVRQA